jgi:hypothetical protein
MNVCFTASRLMKTREVRKLCQKARENQALLLEKEKKRKEAVQTLLQKEKTTSAPTLAV